RALHAPQAARRLCDGAEWAAEHIHG
ncbi:MAG: hypothetical protein QOD44_3985, partial [Solirubrobacteraceae bacterium]|nr:hypothetical protein [Solirubrobacteraceae bacterium]